MLALLGGATIVVVSRLRVKSKAIHSDVWSVRQTPHWAPGAPRGHLFEINGKPGRKKKCIAQHEADSDAPAPVTVYTYTLPVACVGQTFCDVKLRAEESW